ncbi:MAG: NAD(P)-dependent alcohol dehydrogenase [Dehalococcoidia bacterium]|nr:NAD(P)-dependent alcohol dehydrogenase [Dehalococcoidia bacterium]
MGLGPAEGLAVHGPPDGGGGFFRPRHKVLGADIAGVVEAVGSKVERLKPGDEVFGEKSWRFVSLGWGGFAEYATARESSMTIKPASITFEEAAALPQVSALALEASRHNGEIQPGQKVLMNGAGGGVGTLFVQIAKMHGAEVTAVDSAEKLDMLRSIGADHVIDYAEQDFTKNGQQYDLIIDVAASRSTFAYARAVSPGGAYGVIGGSQRRFFQTAFFGHLIGRSGKKKISDVTAKTNERVDYMLELIEAGKVRPVIDKTYPLSETAEAFRYFGEGHVKGKIVITM